MIHWRREWQTTPVKSKDITLLTKVCIVKTVVFPGVTYGCENFTIKKEKPKIMASSPITSWQIEGEKVEAVTYFIFLGSKSLLVVTAAVKLKDACSLEGKP